MYENTYHPAATIILWQVKWGDHVVLVVHLPEGSFIADVGLGEGPRWPFKVENAKWTEASLRKKRHFLEHWSVVT